MAQFTYQSGTVLANGRVIRLVFQTTSLAAGNYSTPDWQAGRLANKIISLNTGAKMSYVGTCSYQTGANLQWIADFEIVDPVDVIKYGDSVTLTIDAAYIQDSQGNTTGAATAQTLVSNSMVGSDGFLSSSIPSGSGGAAVTIYVSYTYGNDSITLAQAQNPATPVKTIGTAYFLLTSNSLESNGSRISFLQGDTQDTGSVGLSFYGSGSASKPIILDTYWYAYSGINTSWQGQRAKFSGSGNGNGIINICNSPTRGYIVLSGLEFNGNNTCESAIWGYNAIINYLTLIDCYIHNFRYGLTIQYQNQFSGNADYFTIHRCIITDSLDGGYHAQGAYIIGYGNVLISQCTFDRNGFSDTNYNSTGILGHNVYIGHDGESSSGKSAARPVCIWRNFVGRSGSFGFQVRIGGNIYKNILTEVDTGFDIGAWGGRAALNYIDKTTGVRYLGQFNSNLGSLHANTWAMYTAGGGGPGADLPGEIKPTLLEMNLIARALGNYGQNSVYVDQSSPSNALSHDHISRNNTAFRHGPIGCLAAESTKPESYSQYKNVVDILANVGGGENMTCVNMGNGNTGPTSWTFFNSNNNIYNTDTSAYLAYVGVSNYSFGTFKTLTGKDTNSITTAATYTDSTADLGTYGGSIGIGGGYSGYLNNIRTRGLSSWTESTNDTWAAIKFLFNKYYNTSQPVLSDSTPTSFYGVPSGFDPAETPSTGITTPPSVSDIKFIINNTIVENNGTYVGSNINYNTTQQVIQALFQNYGNATGVITNVTLTNLTGTSFSLDPVGYTDPTPKIDTFPYSLGYSTFPGGRNIGMSPNSEGTKLASLVLTGDFGTKTAYLQFTVPVVEASGNEQPPATGKIYSFRSGSSTYFAHT